MLLRCAVPTTDEDFILREDRLNSLNYACGLCPELYRCFKDGANREIVLEFLRSCHGTDEGDLWTHIIRVCNALQNALRSINVLTGTGSANMAAYQVSEREGDLSNLMGPKCMMLYAGHQ